MDADGGVIFLQFSSRGAPPNVARGRQRSFGFKFFTVFGPVDDGDYLDRGDDTDRVGSRGRRLICINFRKKFQFLIIFFWNLLVISPTFFF